MSCSTDIHIVDKSENCRDDGIMSEKPRLLASVVLSCPWHVFGTFLNLLIDSILGLENNTPFCWNINRSQASLVCSLFLKRNSSASQDGPFGTLCRKLFQINLVWRMRRKSENPGQKNYDREKNQEALAIAKSEAFHIWLGFRFGDCLLLLWFVHLFIGFATISWKLVII